MKQTLIATARAIAARVNWHHVGIALSLAIVAIAVTTLVRILRDVDVPKIWIALEATPVRSIVIAALLIVAAYLTLTCYDYFALRTINRAHVPYRIAALAAFTSYSIGHNVGATVFTGGAIRYRIYSVWGLSVVDVAKMAFVTGLTFWLGNLFVLGVAISWRPDVTSAINLLPIWANRMIGIAMLLMIVVYIAWIAGGTRIIGRGSWHVALPNPRLTLIQIGIGVADLAFSGLAMCVLLPPGGAEPIAIIVAFVTATLLAFASHAPGGLGVFDAAMLVTLEQYEKEQLIASLLLFRLLYYIVPFALALLALGTREFWMTLATPAEPTDAASEPPAGKAGKLPVHCEK
jgi:uncharacterized membrane protein YbhN (UPF0104 family)